MLKKITHICRDAIYRVLAISISLSLLPLTTYAADPLNPTQGLSTSIDELINGYGKKMRDDYLWKPPYDVENLKNAGNSQEQLWQIPYKQAQSVTLKEITDTLTASNETTVIRNSINKLHAPLVAPSKKISDEEKQNIEKSIASFDLGTLLGPMRYNVQNHQDQQAQNFIAVVSGLNNPMPVPDFGELSDPTLALVSADVDAYLAKLYEYTALRGVALDNLNRAYAKRVPNKENAVLLKAIKPTPTIPDKSKNPNPAVFQNLPDDPSVLQVEQYLATRRIRDPNWYDQMGVASPAEVQRQTLFLLAEMRAEMFQQNMQLERLNLTLSALLLQTSNTAKLMLTQEKSKAQKAIDGLQSSGNDDSLLGKSRPVNLNPKPKLTPEQQKQQEQQQQGSGTQQ
jgi:hypothetical protein